MTALIRRLLLAMLTLEASVALLRIRAHRLAHRTRSASRLGGVATLGEDVGSDPVEVDHLAEALADPEARLSLDVAITRHGFHGLRA